MSLLNPCFWGREGGKYSPGSDKLTKESLGECYSLIIDSQWSYSGNGTVIGQDFLFAINEELFNNELFI